jgi:hypothetical protein
MQTLFPYLTATFLRMRLALLAFLLLIPVSNFAEAFEIHLSASAVASPPTINLSWSNSRTGEVLRIYRKLPSETSWTMKMETNAVPNPTAWSDQGVTAGQLYHYQISRRSLLTTGLYGYDRGYTFAAVDLPAASDRGAVLLVVDHRFTNSLAPEINRFIDDLTGDGWLVIRTNFTGGQHMFTDYYNNNGYADYDTNNSSVSSMATLTPWKTNVPFLKQTIATVKSNTPALNSVILLGHLPVPYSGTIAGIYDGHQANDQANYAYPSDLYYADVASNFSWTDTAVTYATGPFPLLMEGRNDPNDGRFDQTYYDRVPALAVGRIDFYKLFNFQDSSQTYFDLWPGFSEESREKELLRRYLNKDHAFRMSTKTYSKRGILQRAADYNAYLSLTNSFSSLFGGSGYDFGTWFDNAKNNTYLWGGWIGVAAGTYWHFSADPALGSAIFGTKEFAFSDVQIVFGMMHASHKFEWGISGCNVRAALCGLDMLCTTLGGNLGYSSTPSPFLYGMGIGGNIGESYKDGAYRKTLFWPRHEHYTDSAWSTGVNGAGDAVGGGLFGDPTLRLEFVRPPTDIHVVRQATNDVVTWISSTDTNVCGYQVLASDSRSGPFSLAHTNYLSSSTTNFSSYGTNVIYSVFAVRKEETLNSGIFTNRSEAIYNKLRFRDASLVSTNTEITFELTGPIGLPLSVERSSDLLAWSTIDSFSITNGSVTKTYSATNLTGFFRARGTNDSVHYSDNAIGYYHLDSAGTNKWRLLGSHLRQFGSGANTLERLIPAASVPNATKVYTVSSSGSYSTYQNVTFLGGWSPNGNVVINPGEGFWLEKNGTSHNVRVSVCGEVPQGNLRNPVRFQNSLMSSLRPVWGNVPEMMRTYPPMGGDEVVRYNYSTQGYDTASSYYPVLGGWQNVVTVPFGEAFWLNHSTAVPFNWDEFFTAWSDL